jgi:hypothetical protein
MKHEEPVDEKIVKVIYKKISGHSLEAGEERSLKKWMKSSLYYRTLVDDIDTDQQLKTKLLKAYMDDKDEFWTIIITYRAALHSGAKRAGNFWERLFRKNG